MIWGAIEAQNHGTGHIMASEQRLQSAQTCQISNVFVFNWFKYSSFYMENYCPGIVWSTMVVDNVSLNQNERNAMAALILVPSAT